MKKIKYLAIFIGIIGLAILLRPEKNTTFVPEKAEPKKDIISESLKNIPAENKAEDKTSNLPQIDKKEVEKRILEHGKNPILKSTEKIKIKSINLPKTQPDWENPMPLTFDGLKKLYLYFRLKETIPEDVVSKINGAVVTITGAIMPVEVPSEDGTMKRFWLSNPAVVMAGCVFCTPPTLGDLVFVEIPAGQIFKVNREKLYSEVVMLTAKGQLLIEPGKSYDNVEYFYKLSFVEGEFFK